MKKSLKAALKDNLSEALTSPAAAFISSAAAPAPAPVKKPKAQAKPTAAQMTLDGIPEGMRLVAEPKSRRVHLLMRPTAYGWLEAKAQAEGISVNEAINVIIEDAKKKETGK